jgi:uncharacterized damage-inducible protein DinB
MGDTEWVAPAIDRRSEPELGDERSMLEAWLEYHRETLLAKCAGLSGARLAERSVPPSPMSLLGLVRHLAEVERQWFRRRFAGEDVGFIYVSDASPDAEFDDVDPANAAADFAVWAREVAGARAAALGRGLDERFVHERTGRPMSLRFVYTHMIEEYARHNGHADLLRERIDGVTGD